MTTAQIIDNAGLKRVHVAKAIKLDYEHFICVLNGQRDLSKMARVRLQIYFEKNLAPGLWEKWDLKK